MNNLMIVMLVVVSPAISYCGIAMYLRFALAKQLLDVPNERSSHTVPTPRGGGVAFAVVFTVATAVLGGTRILAPQETLAILAGVLVAAVGYWDDRQDVKLRTRLLVQILSACIAVAALSTLHLPGQASSSSLVIATLIIVEIVGLTWVLNLTNFMDGIDGIVAIEIVSVTVICAALIVFRHGITIPAVLFTLFGAIVAPFLLFNWSPAKIFMGDVGSGFLGFTFGTLSLIAVARHQLLLLSPMILFGVFIVDATTTLITRMIRHELWYAPHRTHAYQILARRHGHKLVAGCVGLINFVWLTPLAVAAEHDSHHSLLYVLIAFVPLAVASYLVRTAEERTKIESVSAVSVDGIQNGLSLSTSTENKGYRLPKGFGELVRRYASFFQIISIAIVTVECVYAAFLLHFDGQIPSSTRTVLSEVVVLWTVCQSLILVCFRVHRSHWRFTSAEELPQLVAISLLASAIGSITAGIAMRMHGLVIPRPVYLVEALLSILGFVGLRIFSRLIFGLTGVMLPRNARQSILICSADVSGVSILSEIRRGFPNYRPVGFIDDRAEMRGVSVCGLRVLGSAADLKKLVKKHSIHHVLISAKPSSDNAVNAVREKCREENVELRVVSSFAEHNVELQQRLIRDFAIEELLGRQPISIDNALVSVKLEGRVVMVTGAAGSIGSELCRQIAMFRPSAIVGYEISETALFFLERELSERFPSVTFIPCIGSVQNGQRLAEVLAGFRPEVVYHAAAYKHVPLMEQHLFEAIENNITATQILLRACEIHDVKTFVMISTDKAVRPTSLMGATKRIAELIVRASSSQTLTCVSTRFGNVLGSNGSVIPIFRNQILAGGPVKVTHPSMIRYFMTIPEAAQLVLQASSLGVRNEIYVLAMGEPVRIVDLADRMIRLMGYSPGKEIAIEFTGMRPGEKLYEELSAAEEETVPTSHPKIFVFKDTAIRSTDVLAQVEQLKAACEGRHAMSTLKLLQSVVPDYTPSKELLAAVAMLDVVPMPAELSILTPVNRL